MASIRLTVRAFLLLAIVLATSLGTSDAFAQTLPGFSFRHIGRDEGMPRLSPRRLALDERGHLWVATDRGVLRFDGYRFRLFSPGNQPDASASDGTLAAPPHPFIHAITPRQAGGAWIWNGWGGLLSVDVDTERFTPHATGPSLIPGEVFVYTFTEDREGSLWLGTDRGLARRSSDGSVEWIREVGITEVLALAESKTGRLCAGGASGLWCRSQRVWERVRLGTLTGSDVDALAFGADGSIIIGNERGVYQHRTDGWHSLLPSVNILSLATSADGSVWASGSEGLWRLDPSSHAVPVQHSPAEHDPSISVSTISHIVIDRDDRLWAAMPDAGLLTRSLSPPAATLHAGPGGSASPGVLLALPEADSVWLGGQGTGLCVLRAPSRDCRPIPGELFHGQVHDAARTADGTLWIAAYEDGMRCIKPGSGRMTPCPNLPERLLYPRKLLVARSGWLWVATASEGVFARNPATGSWHELPSTRRLAVADSIMSLTVPIIEDLDGHIWVGTLSGGLYRIRVTERSFAPERVPLLSEGSTDKAIASVLSLAQTPDGRLFAATREGMASVNPNTLEVRWLDERDGMISPFVEALTVDQHGRAWAVGQDAVHAVDSLGNVTAFWAELGTATFTPRWHGAHMDGQRLWVATSEGAAEIDTRRLVAGAPLPAAHLAEVSVDGQIRRLSDSPLRIRPRESGIRIELSATGASPDPHWNFGFRLIQPDGSASWSTLPGSSLQLAGLRPGTYQIQVRTQRGNQFGRPETLSLVVDPFWWETPAARLGLLALLLAIGYASHKYRLDQLQQRLLLRRRIADDLHDDLGAKAGAIALRLDMARQRAEKDESGLPHADQFGTLADEARQLARDVRDVVWVVDGEDEQLAALASRIEGVARSLIDNSRLLVTIGQLPRVTVSMNARRHLLLAAKEALYNAAKYAGPDATVEVEIGAREREAWIAIQDHGAGFNPNLTSSTGRGMRTLERRAREAGARLTLESSPQSGTRVVLAWPL